MLNPKRITVPNRLLAAMPAKAYQSMLPLLKPVQVVFGQVLYEPGSTIKHVYFPNDCLVSLLASVDGRRAAEVGLVGAEGMIGWPVALGTSISPFLAVVQGNGSALRMKVADFRRAFAGSPELQRELLRFTHLLMTQVAQTAACNRFHVVTERLARWLLMTRDRVNANEFRLTQEFLAQMLGVRRVGVSAASISLQKLGLIDCSRGNITITDPRGLNAAACSCYKKVKDLYTEAQD